LQESEDTTSGADSAGQGKFALVSIRLPVALTFAALIGGLVAVLIVRKVLAGEPKAAARTAEPAGAEPSAS